MAESSAMWLRVAALLYSLGLAHAILTLVRRREDLFRYALGAMRFGLVLHGVSVIEQGLQTGHFPANNVYESLSLCALLIAGIFLLAIGRYKLESISVVVFPLVFVMTLAAALGRPVA